MKVLYPVCIIFVLKIDMPMDILFLVGGLLLILLGANGLTDGAASVAKRFHIPSIVIGLTIVPSALPHRNSPSAYPLLSKAVQTLPLAMWWEAIRSIP